MALPSIETVAASVVAQMAAPIEGTTEAPAESAPAAAIEGVNEAEASEATEEASPVAEKTPSPPKEDRFSRQFAAISRKEREFKRKEQELNARYAQLEADAAEAKAYRERKTDAKKTPLKALQELGLTYQDVTNDVLGQHTPPEVDPLDERLRPILERLEKAEKTEEKLAQMERQSKEQAAQQAEEAIRYNLNGAIKENMEKYELCSHMGNEAIELSRQILQVYYDTHGKVLTYEEILDITEKHYEEEVLGKLLVSKKAKTLAGYGAKPAATKSEEKPAKKSGSTSTLTNAQRGQIDTVNVDAMNSDDALNYLIKKHLNKQG